MTEYFVLILLVFMMILFMVFYGKLISAKLGGARDKIKNLSANPRSKSEAEVIKILEELMNAKFPTVRPSWLKYNNTTLELDGYNEKLKLAIEFSGPLHTKWTPSFESYEKYFERIAKDDAKKKLCKQNDVNLIVIDFSLPSKHWRTYLKSRLFDLQFVDNRPADYIPEQVVVPYRNEYIEKNLSIVS